LRDPAPSAIVERPRPRPSDVASPSNQNSSMSPLRICVALAPLILFCACSSDSPSTPPQATLSVSPDAMTLDTAGDQRTLTATLGNANGPITWSSADPAVVAVTQGGAVRAVGPGTAQVSASAAGVSASATVTVRPRTDVRVQTASTRYTGGAYQNQEIVTITLQNLGSSGQTRVQFVSDPIPEIFSDSVRVITDVVNVPWNLSMTTEVVMHTAVNGRPVIRYVRAWSRAPGETEWRIGPAFVIP
jgi:hypothetical protein